MACEHKHLVLQHLTKPDNYYVYLQCSGCHEIFPAIRIENSYRSELANIATAIRNENDFTPPQLSNTEETWRERNKDEQVKQATAYFKEQREFIQDQKNFSAEIRTNTNASTWATIIMAIATVVMATKDIDCSLKNNHVQTQIQTPAKDSLRLLQRYNH